MGTANAKQFNTADTPLLSAYTTHTVEHQKRQAVKAALATLGYRVGQGQVNGYPFRYVIRPGGAV